MFAKPDTGANVNAEQIGGASLVDGNFNKSIRIYIPESGPLWNVRKNTSGF